MSQPWSRVRLSLVGVVAAIGCYLSVFWILFAWIFQDIDGPITTVDRVLFSSFGVVMLVPSLLIARASVRQAKRRWATKSPQ